MTQAFENLNVNALYEVLAEILGEKHGAKISYKVTHIAEEELENESAFTNRGLGA